MSQDIPRGAPGRQPPQPKPRSPLNPGQIVFYPVCTKTTKPGASPYVFNGAGFGVHLGVVPRFAPEPTKFMVPVLMAGIGWISFEDVGDLMGEESLKFLMDSFREKYEAKDAEQPPEPAQIVAPEPSKLIGLDGKPIT